MSNLVHFFFSFDKLMKEKLVIAFFWLAVIRLSLEFAGRIFGSVGLDPFRWILDFFGFFVMIVMALVGVRLLCEIAIAVFRINDNLSPDGGKSETANVDLVKEAIKAAEEAKQAAEDAAKKATAATRSAVARKPAAEKPEIVKPVTVSTADKAKTAPEIIVDPKPAAKPAATKKAPTKTAPAKKTPAKKPTAKKPTAKKPAAKKPAAKKPVIKAVAPKAPTTVKAAAKKAPAKKTPAKKD